MTKTIYWIIGILAAVAVAVFAVMWPASAYYDKSTGTLKLMARFRVLKLPLKDYAGKTGFETIGPVIFDYDYMTPGKITYSISSKANSAKLLSGTVEYSAADTLQLGLPSGRAPMSPVKSCSCNH